MRVLRVLPWLLVAVTAVVCSWPDIEASAAGVPVDPIPHFAVLGDSIAAGPHSFPRILSERLGVPVVNSSIPGDTTFDALERLERVLGGSPRLLIVELGANDLESRESHLATARNLGYIFGRARAAGARVLFLDVHLFGVEASRADLWKPVCRARGVPYVHDVLEGLKVGPDLYPDHVHPRTAGHEAIALRLEPLVRRLLRKD